MSRMLIMNSFWLSGF